MSNPIDDFTDLLLTGQLSEETKEAQRIADYKARVWAAYLRIAEGLAASGHYNRVKHQSGQPISYVAFQELCSDGLGLAT